MPDFKLKFPAETIDLPSKGLVYPKENPLSSGVIEMKYMTAKEEDILTNQNYIKQGVVLDKLMQSLIVSQVNYDDLIVGDKNAILIAARVLGYGSDYEFEYKGQTIKVDLSELENVELDESVFKEGLNEFDYTLPHSKTNITFKLLTGHDDKKIDAELKGLKKVYGTNLPEASTRLKYIITSVEGNKDFNLISSFVDNNLLAKDARELRKYIRKIQPDINTTITVEVEGLEEEVDIPIGVNFFWPDLGV